MKGHFYKLDVEVIDSFRGDDKFPPSCNLLTVENRLLKELYSTWQVALDDWKGVFSSTINDDDTERKTKLLARYCCDWIEVLRGHLQSTESPTDWRKVALKAVENIELNHIGDILYFAVPTEYLFETKERMEEFRRSLRRARSTDFQTIKANLRREFYTPSKWKEDMYFIAFSRLKYTSLVASSRLHLFGSSESMEISGGKYHKVFEVEKRKFEDFMNHESDDKAGEETCVDGKDDSKEAKAEAKGPKKEKKKRGLNGWLLFRSNLKKIWNEEKLGKYEPAFASDGWQKLSKEEKQEWKDKAKAENAANAAKAAQAAENPTENASENGMKAENLDAILKSNESKQKKCMLEEKKLKSDERKLKSQHKELESKIEKLKEQMQTLEKKGAETLEALSKTQAKVAHVGEKIKQLKDDEKKVRQRLSRTMRFQYVKEVREHGRFYIVACNGRRETESTRDARVVDLDVGDDVQRIKSVLNHALKMDFGGVQNGDTLQRAFVLKEIKKKLFVSECKGKAYDTFFLYFSGHGYELTGNISIGDGKKNVITFDDIRTMWEKHKKKQPHAILVLTLDSCHSGCWIDKARENKHLDIFVQSAAKRNQTTEDGLFTNIHCKVLGGLISGEKAMASFKDRNENILCKHPVTPCFFSPWGNIDTLRLKRPGRSNGVYRFWGERTSH